MPYKTLSYVKKRFLLLTKSVALNFYLPVTVLLSHSYASMGAESKDLTDMPLEQLLNVDIISASKYVQRQSDIPATSTVITAHQIKAFGYRTLSDALRSVTGLFVSTEGVYDNLGVRGLTGSGEFNGRIVVLIDGYRLNEVIYDSGSTGTEFPVDVDLIERLEIIRGPASSIYGSNALYGIINVVTKSGSKFKGGEVAASYGSFDTYKGRFSYGDKLDNGLEYLISATGFDSKGSKLFYPDLATPENNYGYTNTSGQNGQQVFAKAGYGDFSLVGAWGRRYRIVPGALYGTNFNDPTHYYEDIHAFVQLQYQSQVTEHVNFTGRAWYGDYQFNGRYPIGDVHNIDTSQGRWSGLELRLLSTYFDKQHISAGVEVQKNWLQRQDNYDQSPRVDYLHDRRNSLRLGFYLQDDIDFTDTFHFTLGGRYDYYSLVNKPMFSLKTGLTWQALENTTLKLLYGSSFRAPNVTHQFYAYAPYFDDNGGVIEKGLKPADQLKPESAQTLQGSWEQKISQNWHTRFTLYHIWLKNLFTQTDFDANYYQNTNGKPQSAWGGELEVEGRWDNGALLRANYSLQKAQTRTGEHLFDSPIHLFKVNFLAPLFHPDWQAGIETQGMSARNSKEGKAPGYVITNATLNWQLHPKVNLSASVYNLFDKEIFDPRNDGIKVPADGRSFRIKLQMDF